MMQSLRSALFVSRVTCHEVEKALLAQRLRFLRYRGDTAVSHSSNHHSELKSDWSFLKRTVYADMDPLYIFSNDDKFVLDLKDDGLETKAKTFSPTNGKLCLFFPYKSEPEGNLNLVLKVISCLLSRLYVTQLW